MLLNIFFPFNFQILINLKYVIKLECCEIGMPYSPIDYP
jgi:hypothetical protein